MFIYPENKEARYCKEIYVDNYNTLTQSILIDLVADQQMSKIEYLDINMEVIKNGR